MADSCQCMTNPTTIKKNKKFKKKRKERSSLFLVTAMFPVWDSDQDKNDRCTQIFLWGAMVLAVGRQDQETTTERPSHDELV